MTVPHWVLTIEDYLRWLQRTIDGSGGIPEPHYVIAETTPIVQSLGVGSEHGAVIDRHELVFPTVGTLSFRLFVVEHLSFDEEPVDLEHVWYSYHFRTDQKRLAWRYDKDAGHHREGPCHLHLPRGSKGEVVKRSVEIDLADAIGIVHSGQLI